MSEQDDKPESFEAFKNSFSYGSRTDLNFKFLKILREAKAADFFEGLLKKLGETIDDGKWARILDHVLAWQVKAYSREGRWKYEEGPFQALQKPLSESRLLLLTSSGHFVEGNDPNPFGVSNMTQETAIRRIGEFLRLAPELSAIPVRTPREKLRARHGGYDVHGAETDPNSVLPLERLREFEEGGEIGSFAPNAYSFVGACAQTLLLKKSGPEWTQRFQREAVDIALLVPV